MLQLLLVLGSILIHTSSTAPLGNEKQFPIGTIIAWKPKNEFDTLLPCGWELCNGQVVEDNTSPMFGYQIPPLNTEQLFLRGASEEKALGMVEMDTI